MLMQMGPVRLFPNASSTSRCVRSGNSTDPIVVPFDACTRHSLGAATVLVLRIVETRIGSVKHALRTSMTRQVQRTSRFARENSPLSMYLVGELRLNDVGLTRRDQTVRFTRKFAKLNDRYACIRSRQEDLTRKIKGPREWRFFFSVGKYPRFSVSFRN